MLTLTGGSQSFRLADLRYSIYVSEDEVRELSGLGVNGTMEHVLDEVELSLKVRYFERLY